MDWLLLREGMEGRAEKTLAATRSTCQLRLFSATSSGEESETSFTLLLDLGRGERGGEGEEGRGEEGEERGGRGEEREEGRGGGGDREGKRERGEERGEG